jgi:hypothetical protein
LFKVFKIVFTLYLLINSNTIKALINFNSKSNRIKSAPNDSIKQKEIIDSITYAKRIQESLLPTSNYIHKNLKHK